MIKPTVGRVVIFKTSAQPNEEFAAIVCRVWNDRMVNLAIFDGSGNAMSRTSVRILQDDEQPAGESYWCHWMPYQKGQAAKTEQLEQQLKPGAA